MDDSNEDAVASGRWTALAWLLASGGWVVNGAFGLGATEGTSGFYWSEVGWVVLHSVILVGLVELARTDALRGVDTARRALTVAAAARVVFIVAELVAIVVTDDEIFLFPIAAVLTGASLTVAGVAALRASRWTRPSQLGLLALGAYPFVFMFPILAVTGVRPDLGLALWGLPLLWIGLGHRALTAAPGATATPGSRMSPVPHPAV